MTTLTTWNETPTYQAYTTITEFRPEGEELERSMSSQESDGWLSKIKQEVYVDPSVEDVFVSIGDDFLVDYWIVIPRRDPASIRSIIARQHEHIINLFSTEHPPFKVDFHICYREGREVRDLVPDAAIHLPK